MSILHLGSITSFAPIPLSAPMLERLILQSSHDMTWFIPFSAILWQSLPMIKKEIWW
jgi:hypothetical protein